MCRRNHLPIHELLHYFIWPNKLSHSSCISWHNHTSPKFWFRTCLIFFRHIYCWNPYLPLNVSNCSSMHTTGPPYLHYYCAVVLHSCIVLPPVGHSSNHEYHCCQLTRQSSCVSSVYRILKIFIWRPVLF